MLIKPKKDIDMRGIVGSLTRYGKWRRDRISPLPGNFIPLPDQEVELPLREQEKIKRLGPVLNNFFEASDVLYRNCPEIRELIRVGKPCWWGEVEENLLSSSQGSLPALYRPDIIVTEEGIKITEVEVAVEGLAFQTVWNETYQDNRAFLSLEKIAANVSSRFVVLDLSLDNSIAESQIIVKWLQEKGVDAMVLSLQEGVGEKIEKGDVVLRPFNLARWTEDFCFDRREAIELSLDGGVTLLNPTSWFEEKTWMGILWHPRYETFLRSRLGEENFEVLRNAVPQTWILHPEFMDEEEINQWLNKKERHFVSKLSGFDLNAWGGRSITFWDKESDANWRQFLTKQMNEGQPVYVVQRYHHPIKTQIWVANLRETDQPLPLIEKKGLLTKICPFYWGDEHIGSVAMLRNNRKIHGASDTVFAPVNL